MRAPLDHWIWLYHSSLPGYLLDNINLYFNSIKTIRKHIMYIKSLIILFSITFLYSQGYTYLLEDINSSSLYYQQSISPSDFTGQVTLHYFGHQNWGTCSARVGNLNNLYNDLLMIKSKYFNNHLNEEELKNYVWDNKVNSKQNFIASYLL